VKIAHGIVRNFGNIDLVPLSFSSLHLGITFDEIKYLIINFNCIPEFIFISQPGEQCIPFPPFEAQKFINVRALTILLPVRHITVAPNIGRNPVLDLKPCRTHLFGSELLSHSLRNSSSMGASLFFISS
jgi:hypothetical protein